MKNTFLRTALTGLLCCLLLSACSTTNRAYYDTLKLVFTGSEPKAFTVDEVLTSKADLLQVSSESGAQAVLALAFIEQGMNKWVSADHTLLKIHDGVIAQTEGFDNDLLFTSHLHANPLSNPSPLAFSWQRDVDIKGVGYGLTVHGKWSEAGEQVLTVLGQQLTTRVVEERVTFPKTTPYIEPGLSWTNRYYLSQNSGEVLKASVQAIPHGDRYTMTYLSRAARLISQHGDTRD